MQNREDNTSTQPLRSTTSVTPESINNRALSEPPQNSTSYHKGDTGSRDKKVTITQEGGP